MATKPLASVRHGGLDYLLFGTVFETASKPGLAPTGISGLAEAVNAAGRLPVLAVGGVTLETIGQLPATGCSGFAAIGQFADCPEEGLAATVAAARSVGESEGQQGWTACGQDQYALQRRRIAVQWTSDSGLRCSTSSAAATWLMTCACWPLEVRSRLERTSSSPCWRC